MAKYNFVWEEPTKRAMKRPAQEAAAKISAASIKLNKAAVAQFGKPEMVVLAYDAQNKAIAIREYGNEENLKAYAFAARDKGRGITLRCKHFLANVQAAMSLDLSAEPLVCPVSYSGRGKMLVLRLSPQSPEAEDEA